MQRGGVLVSPVHAANAEMAAQAGIRAVDMVVK
jgi:hypothetical protein